MKKMICILLSLTLLFGNVLITNAASESFPESVEYLEDGSYFVTAIEVTPDSNSSVFRASTSKCSGSKTVTYKSSSGTKLWSVTINASFSYVKGTSATCTNATISTAVYSSLWKVSNKSSTKSGNKASATATGTQYNGSTAIGSIRKTVTLTCSTYGNIS